MYCNVSSQLFVLLVLHSYCSFCVASTKQTLFPYYAQLSCEAIPLLYPPPPSLISSTLLYFLSIKPPSYRLPTFTIQWAIPCYNIHHLMHCRLSGALKKCIACAHYYRSQHCIINSLEALSKITNIHPLESPTLMIWLLFFSTWNSSVMRYTNSLWCLRIP